MGMERAKPLRCVETMPADHAAAAGGSDGGCALQPYVTIGCFCEDMLLSGSDDAICGDRTAY